MSASNKDEGGFTLIELLVSLALISLMSIFALQAFRILQNFNRIEAEVSSQEEVLAVSRLLTSELENMRAETVLGKNNQSELIFSGQESEIDYVTGSSGSGEIGGIYRVRLKLNADGDLVSERQLMRINNGGVTRSVALLIGIKSLNFGYVSSGSDPSPKATWTDIQHLPGAISMDVEFADDQRRTWPRLAIGIKLSN